MPNIQPLFEKIQALPPERIAEVEEDLTLLFEAVDHFSPEGKMMTKRILQGLIIQAQVQNLAKAT